MAFNGKVQSFDLAKGFGFITTEDGLELFLPQSACLDGTPMPGDAVKFDLEGTKEQQVGYQAANVTRCTGAKGKGKSGGKGNGCAATGQRTGTGQITGTVRQFNAVKGFGFVLEPDGNSLFFHVKQIVDGSMPQQGDFLTFDKKEGRNGKMEACNVTGGTGFAVARGAWGAAQDGAGKGGPYGMMGANAGGASDMMGTMQAMQAMMGQMMGGMGGMVGCSGSDASWSAGGGDASWSGGAIGGGDASWSAGGGDASWSGGAIGGGDASWSAGGCGGNSS